uniref:LRR receptor-like serine/threonine-protein kinase RPK2 n=1 Tax=Cajanus cajan TaxID=3821 RepID=A0A151TBW4_CAJCA|nr:LRR receptor-like serine/threonine-protein kinase RPK2 [Cajanus cajan]
MNKERNLLFRIKKSCKGLGGTLFGKVSPLFGKLTKLRVLSLPFEGEVPKEIWTMEKLEGCWRDSEFVVNVKSLEVLNLAGNGINGYVLGFVGRLRAVYLSFNLLGSLGNCSELRTVLLYSNVLEDVILGELGRLRKLEVLDVSRNIDEFNYYEGTVLVEIMSLPKLRVLWAPRVNMEGSLMSNCDRR